MLQSKLKILSLQLNEIIEVFRNEILLACLPVNKPLINLKIRKQAREIGKYACYVGTVTETT